MFIALIQKPMFGGSNLHQIFLSYRLPSISLIGKKSKG
jgi:hypothetical protein